jgi:hypothetical protein
MMLAVICQFASLVSVKAQDPTKWYIIKNRDSGLNIRSEDCGVALETKIELINATGDCSQWRFIHNNGRWLIQNKASGLYIRHDGESVVNDQTLAELIDSNGDRTYFQVIDAGGGYVNLQHVGSGLNLRNSNCERVNDQTQIEFYSGNAECAQWQLTPVANVTMAQVIEGADPELRNFDGNYYMYVTNSGPPDRVVRCLRPYDNNGLRATTWYATTAYTMPSYMNAGWAPAVVRVGSEYRMYLTLHDTRGPDPRRIYLLTSNNPSSGFVLQNVVIPTNAGGCPDIADAAIDGNIIYYGGALGGGCYMADLTNNGRTASNFRKATGLTNFSEGAFVGEVPGVGKLMLYARGFYDQDSYGTNWATGGPQAWTYRGQVQFPQADQFLFRLGHASTSNGWIAVNSIVRGRPRHVAIGKLALVSGNLHGTTRANTNLEPDAVLTIDATVEDVTEVQVVADFGEVNPNEVKVYPNPMKVKGDFYIAINATRESSSVNISIYNLAGALVKQISKGKVGVGVNSYQLNGDDLKTGQHVLKVTNHEGMSLGETRLIVE